MPGLIGRAAPLAALRAALDAGAQGRPAAVLVGGEPGIGKTRLVDALAGEAGERGVAVLHGRADADGGAPALWPWLRALAGRPERADLLAAVTREPPRTADPAAAALLARDARTLAFDAVLDTLAADRPLVVLEDLHWADEATLDLLVLAADRPGLVVVGTHRTTEPSPALRSALAALGRLGSTRTVTLHPWTPDDVAQHAAGTAHPGWAPVLHRTGGGVPLLVGELLRALVDSGRAAHPAPAGGWPGDVPDRLVDAVGDRLDRLGRRDPAARAAVEAACVVGAAATPAHLLALGAAPDAAAGVAALSAGAAAGLLTPARDGHDPAHALVRDAVRARLDPARRLAWHAALADAIEAGALPGDPVAHRLQAAVDPAARPAAVRACRAAAAAAAGALAPDRAIELLDAALALPGTTGTERAELLLDAAAAEFAAGRSAAAARRGRAVAAATADPGLLVRAALVVRGINGPVNAVLVELCDTALAALDAAGVGDGADRARVLAQRALALADLGGWDEIGAASARALELAERSGSPLALADALRARQHAVSGTEGVTERLELARRSLELAASAGLPDAELWGRLWRVDAALQLGAVEVLDAELAGLGRLAGRLGWPIAAWHHHRLTAARMLMAGRFAEAAEQADRALAAARRTDDLTAIGIDTAFRTELMRLQGRHDEMTAVLREVAARNPAVVEMPIFAAQSGWLLTEAGHTDDGHRCLDRLRPVLPTLPRDGRWLPTVAMAGELAAALGDTATVTVALDLLRPHAGYFVAGGSGSVRCDGSAARVAGALAAALGRDDEAEQLLTRAVGLEDRAGALPYRVWSEIRLGRVLARTPAGRERAAALGLRAAATARRLGMAPALARADELVREVRAAGPAVALTPRERDVLAAVARGHTNRQIADELVLSERTVETHVGHVLAKLGVPNRAGAAVWADRNGLAHPPP